MKKSLLYLLPIFLWALCFHTPSFAAETRDGVTHLSQAEFMEAVKDKNTVIIDVRTKQEYHAGHIANAVNIPHFDVLNDISLLDPYLGKNMIFYCHTGVRVRRVTNYLKAIGYLDKENIFHLKGDIRSWRARGLPLEK